jgi:hypothetical protein
MFLYVVDCQFNVVFVSVKVELKIFTLFFHSIIIHSDFVDVNFVFFAVILAVE